MGTLTDGADVGRLREIAGQLTGGAEQIDDVGSSGSQLLTVLAENWSGPDLEQVSSSWPDVQRSIDAASTSVRGMGEALRRNADEQDQASSGGGGSARSGGPAPGGNDSGDNASGDPQPGDSSEEKYGELDPEVEEAWDELSDDERDAVLDQIIAQQAERYGISPPPDITYDHSMTSNQYGSYNDSTGVLKLNPDLLDDPQLAINTIVHEMRHAGQHEAIREANPGGWWIFRDDPEYIDGMTPEEIDAWDDNFDDYKSTKKGDTFQEYWDQPVEVDAREAGRDYVNDLTPEEFDDLVEQAEQERNHPGPIEPGQRPPLPGPNDDPSPSPPEPSPGPSPEPPS